MGKTLIIGEKREAMEDMLKHLPDKLTKKNGYWEGSKYLVSWAMGHLYILEFPHMIDPTYGLWKPLDSLEKYKLPKLLDVPFVPDNSAKRYDAKYHKDQINFAKMKGKQIATLKSLLERNNLDEIILAPDADDEGERIGQDVVWHNQTSTVKKLLSQNKVTRFWNTGSFKVKAAIDKALKERKPITEPKFSNLNDTAIARVKSDYLFGMKPTKLLSEKHRKMISGGRVQSSVLHIIRKREDEINNFKPKDYWTLKGIKDNHTFNHYFIEEDVDDNGKTKKVEKTTYFNKDELDEVLKDCNEANLTGKVTKYDNKKTKSSRPTLLSTGDFQSFYMDKLGGTLEDADLVLEYLRDEGYTTYPRTDGHYFAKEDVDEVKTALKTIKAVYSNESNPLEKELSQTVSTNIPIFNDAKAKKQNHTPLNVTDKIPNQTTFNKWENVNYKKKKLKKVKEAYFYILNIMAAQFLPDDEVIVQKIEFEINGHAFKKDGRKIVKNGWRDALNNYYKDTTIDIDLKVDSEIKLDKIELETKKTTKPPRYTIKSLLKTMINVNKALDEELNSIDDPIERKKRFNEIKKAKNIFKNIEGIGTNATRKTILGIMKKRTVIETKGKKEEVYLTEFGRFVDDVTPYEFKRLDRTALWEEKLDMIRQGQLNKDEFIKEVNEFIDNQILPEIYNGTKVFNQNGSSETLGTCPLCKTGNIFETKKSFSCTNWNKKDATKCNFTIWKNQFEKLGKKTFTKTDVKKLLKDGKITLKLKSKAGKPYEKTAEFKDGKLEIIW